MSKVITSSFINNIKKSAKVLKKELSITHSSALEIASKNAGHDSYHSLLKAFQNQNQNQNQNKITPSENIKLYLMELVRSDFGRSTIEQNRFTIAMHNTESNLDSVVLEKLLDVFENGINHDGINRDPDWSILAWSLDKEAIKNEGYKALKNDEFKIQILGGLLVALGHFYRSATDSLASGRLIHPCFDVYVADWIRTNNIGGEKITSRLHELYPNNVFNGLSTGTTYWKPE